MRQYGIRTATDLKQVYMAYMKRRVVFVGGGQEAWEEAPFYEILDQPDAKVKRLQVILDTLKDDEWLAHIRNWRAAGARFSLQEYYEEPSG